MDTVGLQVRKSLLPEMTFCQSTVVLPLNSLTSISSEPTCGRFQPPVSSAVVLNAAWQLAPSSHCAGQVPVPTGCLARYSSVP
ncbi:hypothetical protein [Pseudonocardia sp. 73-21]|uniref:hypothetical protein n=1 Tax=Pseudonocardia sp. 73-21 TaxID=1895809 RepID=UPI0026056FA9|nr:hypothetical protein [Pseudonocardia sp. 73-21]